MSGIRHAALQLPLFSFSRIQFLPAQEAESGGLHIPPIRVPTPIGVRQDKLLTELSEIWTFYRLVRLAAVLASLYSFKLSLRRASM